MAHLTPGNFAIRFDDLGLDGLLVGDYLSRTSTLATVALSRGIGGFQEEFSGTGFTYANGLPSGGTLTGWRQSYAGEIDFTITGINANMAAFVDAVQRLDKTAVLSMIFGGDDTITASARDDIIGDFWGNNFLLGGAGYDEIYGGDGNDHIYGRSAEGGDDAGDLLAGGGGGDYVQGNAGDDTINGDDGADRINGGADDDRILGAEGDDSINGNRGADSIDGGGGKDLLRGGQGDDSISGGADDDMLSGDRGIDSVAGGAGIDRFRFEGGSALFGASADVITDFGLGGSERLDIGFTPGVVLTGGAQSGFADAIAAARGLIEGHAGDHEVAVIAVGNDAYVVYAGDGGANVDSAIKLEGICAGSISVEDFV